MDDDGWNNLEIDQLILRVMGVQSDRHINFEEKTLEAISLVRSFCHLPTDVEHIRLRQEAGVELASSPALERAVNQFLQNSGARNLLLIMDGPETGQSWYGWYHECAGAVVEFCKAADRLPRCSSPLLQELFKDLQHFRQTELARRLMHGCTYTLRGVMASCDVPFNSRGFRFWPFPVDPAIALTGAAAAGSALGALAQTEPGLLYPIIAGVSAAATLGLFGVKIPIDKELVLHPLHEMAQTQLVPALNSIANLKGLLALNRFFRDAKLPSSSATLVPADEVIFVAQNMGSPLHSTQADFVLNDASIGGPESLVLCGPNSGGKTTWIKSVMLNLLLCQAHGRGFFSAGKISPATKIGFTVPKQNQSSSTEGRFGEELGGIADHLDVTVDSRTILGIDEIGSGTSEKAATPIALPILKTMQFCGMRVILATHNLDLLDTLDENFRILHPDAVSEVQPDGRPGVRLTHKIVEGRFPEDMDPALYARQVAQRMGVDEDGLSRFREEWLRAHPRPS